MSYLMAAVQLVGGSQNALSEEKAGYARRTENRVQAVILDRNAQQREAVGIMQANEERRAATLVASRAKALAASSGTVATEGNPADVMAGIKDEGEYRAMLRMYDAGEEATGDRMRATALRAGGDNEVRAARARALATSIDSITSAYDKYGDGVGEKLSAWNSRRKAKKAGTYSYDK